MQTRLKDSPPSCWLTLHEFSLGSEHLLGRRKGLQVDTQVHYLVLQECPRDVNSAPRCVSIPVQVTLKPEQTILPLVDEALQHTTTKGIVFQHPETVAHMDLVRQELHLEPFYWKLPEQFEGKKVNDKNLKGI